MFKPLMVAFNKPKGYVVSKADKFNKTIYEFLPKSWQEDFYYIGRLDKDSRGLLLLTNVPELVNEYEHPRSKIYKIYEVKIDKFIKSNHLMKLKRGVWITEDGEYIPDTKINEYEGNDADQLQFYDINLSRDSKGGSVIARIVLTYGKKRHIRRALKAFGYKVYDLCRIKYGKYELGDIRPGKYRIYPYKDVVTKRAQRTREKEIQEAIERGDLVEIDERELEGMDQNELENMYENVEQVYIGGDRPRKKKKEKPKGKSMSKKAKAKAKVRAKKKRLKG